MANQAQRHFVYILQCADGVFYVGATEDLESRVAMHNEGRGPKFTACRLPVTLLYPEEHDSMSEARQREIQIKKWSRAKKEAFIAGNRSRLHELSKRRGR